MRRIVVVATVMILASVSSHEAAAQCTKQVSRQELIDETVHLGTTCCFNGWSSFGAPIGGGLACGDPGTLCPRVRVRADIVNCQSGVTTPGGVVQCTGVGSPDCCSCDAGSIDFLNQHKDGSTELTNFGCEASGCGATGNPEPQTCDAKSALNIPPFDAGCKDDEHSCKKSDQDRAPVRFSSGRVETNPITVFAVPTPDGISFEYRVIWGSHDTHIAAQARVVNGTQDTVPTLHDSDEVTHFLGTGWQDSFSDRLLIDVHDKSPNIITWQSMDATITFSSSSGWKSWSGKYELIDRGANPVDGLGRWVVRTTDTSAPRQIWSFEEFSSGAVPPGFTYTSYGGSQYVYKLGRLRRHASLTSNLEDLNGRYGFTVSWTSDGLLSQAVDTLGRTLLFQYYSTPPSGGVTRARSLSGIQYKPTATATAIQVATLQMDPSETLLDRIVRADGNYTRFLYWRTGSTVCALCGSKVTDVIVPATNALSTPAVGAPLLANELVIEHNDYAPGLVDDPSYNLVLGVHSKYPGREYAYEFRTHRTTQFDLHQDTGACASGTCLSCAPLA